MYEFKMGVMIECNKIFKPIFELEFIIGNYSAYIGKKRYIWQNRPNFRQLATFAGRTCGKFALALHNVATFGGRATMPE